MLNLLFVNFFSIFQVCFHLFYVRFYINGEVGIIFFEITLLSPFVKSIVADPYNFQADPDPAFLFDADLE